ncbi:MAG: hypothetical protein IKX59_11925 [Bacteroidales bacterium]|nr:hypothetical protein [Bacteroidales bacterium]
MKTTLTLILALLILPAASAQHLVKDDFWTLEQIGEGYYDVEISMIYEDNFGITGRNEVKGSIISGIWFRDASLTPPDEVAGLQVSFFEKTDFGYYAVFDEPDCNIIEPRTVLVLYNHEKTPTRQFLLSDVFTDGRVVDFRYSDGRFYLAMGSENRLTEFGYFSYQLYCFDIQADRIVWRTNYEVCNSQFDVLDKYVVSGFGGAGIDDYVYLIDRRTGVALDYVPTPSVPQYIEATRTQDTVYVVDYNNIIYRYLILDRCVHVTGRGVRLRRGPSTDHAIFSDAKGRPIYPLAGDNLAYLGQSGDFYKVRFKQQVLYISKRYTELRNPMLEKQKLLTRFQEALNSRGDYVAAPVSILFVDVDDDGIDERICKDLNDRLAVFTARNQQHELLFIDNLDNTHVYPSSGAFRTYMSFPNGYESEAIYLIKNSRLQATYLRENDTYSKIVAPASSSSNIKAKEYEAQRSRLQSAPELTLDSCFDL